MGKCIFIILIGVIDLYYQGQMKLLVFSEDQEDFGWNTGKFWGYFHFPSCLVLKVEEYYKRVNSSTS